MPVLFYRSMSDRDAHAIATYLRSLRPIANKVPEPTYKVPPPQSYGPPITHVPDPDPADRIAVGKYLATIGHCMLCHTPMVNGRLDLEHRLGAGGARISGVFGERITPNITQDRETGIGGWTSGQIKTALTKGLRPDGRLLASPMPWRYLSTMTDEDISAIVAYLQTLTPVQNRIY
jgi:mono/diheme cytochrome c family protein